jgi:hypothetical protein
LETLYSEFSVDVIIFIDPFRGGPGFHWDDFNVVAFVNIVLNSRSPNCARAHTHRQARAL